MKALISSLLVVLLNTLVFHLSSAQTSNVDSLNEIIESTTASDSLRIEAMNALSMLMYSKPEQAKELNQRAISESKQYQLINNEISSYLTRALLFYQFGRMDSSEYYCKKAIKINKDDDILLGKCYNLLGSVNQEQGNDATALKSYSIALDKFKAISFPSGIGASLNRIGIFYTNRNDYKTALQYYTEALEIFNKLDRYDQITGILNNIAICYYQGEQYQAAIDYFLRSMDVLEEHHQEQQRANREFNIGKTYIKLKDYQLADSYLKNALAHARDTYNKKVECLALLYLGLLESIQYHNHAAYRYFDQGLEIAIKYSFKETEMEYYKNMANTFAQDSDFRQAYKYHQRFAVLKDSLFTADKNKEMLLMQSRFEAKQKEQQIAMLQHQGEKKNIIMYALIIGSIFLVILLVLILVNYNSKQNNLKLIHQQKEEISRQKITDLLKDQELNSIKNKLEGQENERKRIARELHDGIGGTLASIKMNLLKINASLQPHISDIIHRLDAACEEVRTISHNLVPPVFYNSAFTDIIRDFVDKLATPKDIVVNYEFYPKRKLEEIDKNIQIDIYRIIQELVTNVVKHANASELNIYLTKHDGYINLMVEDDGEGIKKDKQSGIGLKNISSRVQALNGMITIDSNIGLGTTVIIDLSLVSEKTFSTTPVAPHP